MRLCAISVDLDEIPNYFQIHGLEAPEGASTAVYDVAMDRLSAFARDAQLPLTEVNIHYGSFLLTARELRGGVIIFLLPQSARTQLPT